VKAELYQQIGKLQVKVDWLKNSRDFHVSGATRMDRRTSRRPQYRQAMRADRDLQGRAVLQAVGGERREPAVDAFAGRAVHPDAVLWGAPDEALVPCDVRHRGSAILVWAHMLNCGNLRSRYKGKGPSAQREAESTDMRSKGGAARSSAEVAVMVTERRAASSGQMFTPTA
jgi:hypothetical protein